MRICIITKYIPPVSTDGIPRNRWEYARQFVKMGHEVHVITSGISGVERIEEGVFIHEIPIWEESVWKKLFVTDRYDEVSKSKLRYSYIVYERIRALNSLFPIDIIDSPLWDIEGYVCKIRLPHIPMIVRLETTSMLLSEIISGSTPTKNCLNELETHFMDISNAIIFDSWSILNETKRLYNYDFNKKKYTVIHHGIEVNEYVQDYNKRDKKKSDKCIKIISVGRLEKRKGSDILVSDILPDLLNNQNDVEIHLVGKDSGEWDGFKQQTGLSYHEYIKKNFGKYVGKKIFIHGYVTDEKLNELYESADITLALSRYESFGLLYLESMKKRKPLIVFQTGSVPEIFENGKDAVVIPLEKPEKVNNAIAFLKENPLIREEIAKNALKKLETHFSASQMGKKSSLFFEDIVYNKDSGRVFQIMNCLTDKDGVSNTTIGYDQIFKHEGLVTQILGTWATERVKYLQAPIENYQFTESDLILYHYWNFCEKGDFFNDLFLPKKVLFFHNFTPPNFFEKDDAAYEATSKGFQQLPLLDGFDVYVCHTKYSAEIIKQALKSPITTFIIPPVIDKTELLEKEYSKNLIPKNKAFTVLYVSSIAPHKKQTELVDFFAWYVKNQDTNATLLIVGGGNEKYVKQLKALIKSRKVENNVKMTGKVNDQDLYAYYRSADLYLSMCEHEGFGVPLAEAMAFSIPVMAYRCTAIPDTVGENGLLFEKKDFKAMADLINKLRNSTSFKEEVIELQNQKLKDFSPQSVKKKFEELKTVVTPNYRRRITKVIQSGQKLIEDKIYYNDTRLKRNGLITLRDGHRLLIEKKTDVDSFLELNEAFDDLQINFYSHPWSGKVKLILNELYEHEVDLYSPEGKIKAIKLPFNTTPGHNKLKIRASGEKNDLSKGCEVYFDNIILFKNFRSQLNPNIFLANQNDKKEKDLETVVENQYDELSVNSFPVMEEITAMSEKITFHGDWILRDKYFKYADGSNKNNWFEFKSYFSTLELLFISHSWSGKINVEVDDKDIEVLNLYSDTYSEKKFIVKQRFLNDKEHNVRIKAIGIKDRLSKGNEIFFKGARTQRREIIDVDEKVLENSYKVSIIINTYNRAKHLKNLLEELENQTYPYFEIVVVNGPSNDETTVVLSKYINKIKILNCPEANLSMSRNIGIENAAGDYVAFMDDDALPCDKDWVKNFIFFIIKNHDKKIGAIGGPVKHKNTEHYEFKNGATSDYGFQIFREEELVNHQLDGKRWVQGVPGGNNIVLKKALYEIGGFDERFIYYLDETDMCIRLSRNGYIISNNPTNYIRHFKAPSAIRKGEYDIRWDIIARSDTFYSLKNGSDKFLIRLFKTIKYFRKKHFNLELSFAFKDQKINKAEYKNYKKNLRKGFRQGIYWGITKKKAISFLKKKETHFLNFRKN